MLVRFIGAPNPRVNAAADRSSPIRTVEVIIGTSWYSTTSPALTPPNRIPRIPIARLMDFHSAPMVGNILNITDMGMVIA